MSRKGAVVVFVSAFIAFVAGMAVLSRFLKNRDRQGYWDKAGYGTPEHPEPGLTYRRLEVPPREPFD